MLKINNKREGRKIKAPELKMNLIRGRVIARKTQKMRCIGSSGSDCGKALLSSQELAICADLISSYGTNGRKMSLCSS
jgi:hypothetical protein